MQAGPPPPGQSCASAQATADTARIFPGAGRARSHPVGRVAAAAQPDQHRHRSRRAHLGGRRGSLPLPSARQPEGDRIVVLQDTDGDGKADSTHTFVQEPALIAPLGVSVIDNKVIVAQPPDLIVYTDVDRNLRFDPAVDKREVLLTGFQGINHDHSLHSVTVGPDGKWMFNAGNTGGTFTDKSGKTFRIFGAYRPGPVGPFKYPARPGGICRESRATMGTCTWADSPCA